MRTTWLNLTKVTRFIIQIAIAPSKKQPNKDRRSTVKNFKQSFESLLTSNSHGYSALFKSAANGALAGLFLSPSYILYKQSSLTRFTSLKMMHSFHNNQSAFLRQMMRIISKPLLIGASIGVAYTAFFTYVWSNVPFREEYSYPVGFGTFASALMFMAGSKNLISTFIFSYVVGEFIRSRARYG